MNALQLSAVKDSRYKMILSSTFFFGILSQGMGLFNKYSVLDDPENYSVGVDYTSGRWMLGVLGDLEKFIYGDGHFSLPLFNGFLAIVLIAASAYLIINMLELRSTVSCVFVPGIMVAFPVVTSIFGFMFTAHLYMLSLFFSILGAWMICMKEEWYYRLFGAGIISASIGIYQAFFPVTTTVILLYLLKHTLDLRNRGIYKKSVVSLACSVVSMGLYFIINHLFLSHKNLVLSDYKGINSVWNVSLSDYLRRAKDAYMEFIPLAPKTESYFYSDMFPYNLKYIYFIIIIAPLILCIIQFFRLFKYDRKRALFFAFLLLLFPLSVNLIIMMAGKNETHSIMVYAQVFPFILFAWFIEKYGFPQVLYKKTVYFLTLSIMLLSLGMYCRVDNKCYLRATFAQQNAISYFTTLITQIKSTEYYHDEMPVTFINANAKSDLTFLQNEALMKVNYTPYYMDVGGYLNVYSWDHFMRQWCGFAPVIVDSNEYELLEEVINMPHYPDYGSIRIINDTVVVKF